MNQPKDAHPAVSFRRHHAGTTRFDIPPPPTHDLAEPVTPPNVRELASQRKLILRAHKNLDAALRPFYRAIAAQRLDQLAELGDHVATATGELLATTAQAIALAAPRPAR